MRITSVFLLVIFILFGCEKSTDPITKNDALVGQWSESFQTYYTKTIVIPGDTTFVFLDRQTTLKFMKDRFTVGTLPHIPSISGVHDTVYQGTYYIKSDTLVFLIENFSLSKKLLFQLRGEELLMEIPSYPINDSLSSIEISSFVWGGSMAKTSGIFRRLKEK